MSETTPPARHAAAVRRQRALRPARRATRETNRAAVLSDSGPGPFGFWLARDDEDLIVYQQETSRLHQVLIILHEVGHMVAGHDSDETDEELVRQFRNLDPDTVRRWLRRTDYHSGDEVEAEKIATTILEWAWELDSRATELPRTEAGRRLRGGLRDHVGWI